jgi:hypothetical protein
MSPDFRYHIASLAAVFLALGVGILVGTAFVGTPMVSRQTRLIRHLEAGVNDLQRQTTERQGTEEALRVVMPAIIRGKLAGKRALVVQTGAYPDAANEAADALRLAGATVERVTLPLDTWTRPGDGDTAPPTEEAITREARPLAILLAGAANGPLTSYHDRGLLTGDSPLGGAVRYVVLVGGAASAPKSATDADPDPAATLLARTRDAALARAWQEQGVAVAGVEPFDAGVSYMRTYETAGIPTVDSIDRAAGKIALPFVLLGEKGNYGLKQTADRVLPPSLDQLTPSPGASVATDGP